MHNFTTFSCDKAGRSFQLLLFFQVANIWSLEPRNCWTTDDNFVEIAKISTSGLKQYQDTQATTDVDVGEMTIQYNLEGRHQPSFGFTIIIFL